MFLAMVLSRFPVSDRNEGKDRHKKASDAPSAVCQGLFLIGNYIIKPVVMVVSTTMIYTHVLNKGAKAVRSPLDEAGHEALAASTDSPTNEIASSLRSSE